jgi:threonine dehydrogenase-like Zn-dependent dehydrogenase
MELPDPSEWLEAIETWLGPSVAGQAVLVGESGDGTLVGSLSRAGRQVVGVEPRGASVWRSLDSLEPGDGTDPTVVFSDVLPYLSTVPDGGVGAVVLLGCSDRLDLVGKVRLLEQSVRAVRPGGTIVVLATDGAVWERALSIPERDLAPGRPLHLETWSLLLSRAGAVDPRGHAAESGALHAVVAKVRS